MKHIQILFLFLFIGTTAMAQDGQLIIDGLNDDASESVMVLKKVTLEGTLTYIVQKNSDGISDELKKAATDGRVFDRARLWRNSKNGNRFVFTLTDVYISDYSTNRGSEQFKLHFVDSEMAQ
jgi:type VI protein secretion system component Hcp